MRSVLREIYNNLQTMIAKLEEFSGKYATAQPSYGISREPESICEGIFEKNNYSKT